MKKQETKCFQFQMRPVQKSSFSLVVSYWVIIFAFLISKYMVYIYECQTISDLISSLL